MTMPIDESAVRAKLQSLKAELEALSEISEEARAPVTLDQQSVGRLSRMDALQGQAMAQASERQRRAQIQSIDAALHRLDVGDYGFCVDCGEDISPKRLAVDPAAAFCIKCAS
ncbi:TraR/DksA C4-type zinc finger protein [uncultured Roseibium sp.]|uniref:TraR/DksA family transcriptional regulator n=1 Tax=uncultured Roseibium sp. TaxID=1936171 RepID=UPI002608FDFA|nr:TraR/DksA C4-type zinc finger protein [uncultured Roseibium sp.]